MLIRPILFCLLVVVSSLGWAQKSLSLVSTEYPPYFASDLPEGGTLTAITRAALKAEGYELKVIYRPWARLMNELEHGDYDGTIAVWYKAERERFIAYSDPIADTRIGFYGRRNLPLKVDDLSALQTRTIGTVRGYANPEVFEAANLRTEVTVDDLTNLKKLAADRLDLVLIDMALANWLISTHIPDSTEKLRALDPPVQTMPLYIGFSRRLPGYEKVMADFNRGLAKIRRTGEYAQILKRLPLSPASRK